MLSLERHDGVTRLRFSTPTSRALGYDSSAYFTRGVLVDTGFPTVAGDLAAWLNGERIRGVVITHHHEDHAGNLELVAARGIPIAAAGSTLAAVRSQGRIGLYRRICWGSPTALRSAVTPFTPEGLQLLPCPGHTPDHHVVWDAEQRTLFAGDLFLGVKVRAAQDTENIPVLARSLRAAIALAPERVFCAHRGLIPDPVGTLRAKADWLDGIIAECIKLRDAGLSEGEITRRLLGREGAVRWLSGGELSKRNLVKSCQRSTVNVQQ